MLMTAKQGDERTTFLAAAGESLGLVREREREKERERGTVREREKKKGDRNRGSRKIDRRVDRHKKRKKYMRRECLHVMEIEREGEGEC